MTTVGMVGSVRLGRQRSPENTVGTNPTKYLRAANIGPDGLDLSDVLEMDFTPSEREQFALAAGDVVLAEASGSPAQVGRSAIWNDEIEGCCFQNTVIRFRSQAASPKYAQIVFRHFARSGVFANAARGVGIQHLGGTRFAELHFPLPPSREQERIVQRAEARLEEIRGAERSLRSALARVTEQDHEIIAAAVTGKLVPTEADLAEIERRPFIDALALIAQRSDADSNLLFDREPVPPLSEGLFAAPKGWAWFRVEDVGAVTLGRQRSPRHHLGTHMRPYLRVANVYEDRIDTTDVKEMNFTPEEFETYSLKHGDILLNEGQSPELVGRPAMFRNEVAEACFQNTLIRFRASNVVFPEFALLLFRYYLHSGAFTSVARWSTNIAHLGVDRFRAMPFPLPPLAEQSRIVAEADSRLKASALQSTVVANSLARLPEMERELLLAAVSGQLVAQDSSDTPADGLLQRGAAASLKAASTSNSNVKKSERSMATAKGRRAAPTADLADVLRKAGRPLPLPELFARAGFDKDRPEHVEQFYLALRVELDRTVRQVGADKENAMVEAINDAPR